MGALDKFKDQAQNKAKDVTGSVGDEVDEKTGGKYEEQVGNAQGKAQDALGIDDEQQEQE